jgi:hypothetical protein
MPFNSHNSSVLQVVCADKLPLIQTLRQADSGAASRQALRRADSRYYKPTGVESSKLALKQVDRRQGKQKTPIKTSIQALRQVIRR